VIIVDAPQWLKGIVNRFGLSHHQKKLLGRYVTGLVTANGKTVSAISSLYISQSSESLNRLLAEYSWDERSVNRQRLEVLQEYNQTGWAKRGLMLIDDTILEKRGKKIPYAGWFYDHAKDRLVWGQCMVTMHYADSKSNYAIDYRHYVKKGSAEFRTKIDLAEDLIEYGDIVPADTIVWDSWYTCRQLVDCAEKKGKFWIGGAKSNLLARAGRKEYHLLDEYADSIPPKRFRTVVVGKRECTQIASSSRASSAQGGL
jgi:hypothetical protein